MWTCTCAQVNTFANVNFQIICIDKSRQSALGCRYISSKDEFAFGVPQQTRSCYDENLANIYVGMNELLDLPSD